MITPSSSPSCIYLLVCSFYLGNSVNRKLPSKFYLHGGACQGRVLEDNSWEKLRMSKERSSLLSPFLGKNRAKYIIVIKIRLKFMSSLKSQVELEWYRDKAVDVELEDIGQAWPHHLLVCALGQFISHLQASQFLCIYCGILSISYTSSDCYWNHIKLYM